MEETAKSGRTARWGGTNVLNSSRLDELFAPPFYGVGLAPDAEVSAFTICAFIQHLTACIDFTAQLLCRPGKEKLGLDEILLEKCNDRLVQPGNIVKATRAHHDARWVLRTQRRFAFGLRRCIADVVDLVEDADARDILRADLGKHFIGDLKLALKSGVARIDDME